ncbi:MAG: iron uptake porin, partial [Cyanobacteria bacterium]|nr:iron uptake porin [Cyanobacteriota bacterium]
MNLFQKLLLAPAALGLLAPVAASAADMNLAGVKQYAAADEQVTSISQFSDVQPTDWAYQALSNLVERYGCVAGYPNGTFQGKKAMTRFEAAALLNACLDRVTEVTDQLKKLMKEFEKELAILKGRVDGLEARVGTLEANQFSTTTKLKGSTYWVMGGNSFGGTKTVSDFAANFAGGTTFNYDLRLDLDTSFTGKDLLRTRLRAGNFGASGFGNKNALAALGYPNQATLNALEVSWEAPAGANSVAIDRLFYQFPLGNGFTFTGGPRVRQDDMLAMWPSAYPADTILDIFTYAGAPGAYSLNLGGGAGLWWQKDGFSVSANYVSSNANVANQNGVAGTTVVNASTGVATTTGAVAEGGVLTSAAASSTTVQLGYAGSNWGTAFAYTYSQNGASVYGG